MWLSSEECKPIQLLPETEGLQGALAFLYKRTPNETDQSSKIVDELYNSDSVNLLLNTELNHVHKIK